MAAKYTHLMRETGLSWNIDTDFPVILTFCLRRLDENGLYLYNYICICCQMSVVKELTLRRHSRLKYTAVLRLVLVGCVRPMVLIDFASTFAFLDRPLFARTKWTNI